MKQTLSTKFLIYSLNQKVAINLFTKIDSTFFYIYFFKFTWSNFLIFPNTLPYIFYSKEILFYPEKYKLTTSCIKS